MIQELEMEQIMNDETMRAQFAKSGCIFRGGLGFCVWKASWVNNALDPHRVLREVLKPDDNGNALTCVPGSMYGACFEGVIEKAVRQNSQNCG